MKKIKFLSVCFILLTSSFLTSCSTDVEPLDPAVVIPDPEDGEEEGGTSTGDYWPMAIDNQWTFIQEGENQAPMKIVSTEQIDGKTYYKYENFLGTTTVEGSGYEGTVWTRKNNGNYYVRQEATIPGVGGNPTITVEPLEINIFKDYLDVDETWTQNVEQTTIIEGLPPVVTQISIEGKVLEKDITLTVNGEEFPNVIKVQVIQSTQGVVNTNYYWFAKDVGIVKFQNIYGGLDNTFEIGSYTVN